MNRAMNHTSYLVTYKKTAQYLVEYLQKMSQPPVENEYFPTQTRPNNINLTLKQFTHSSSIRICLMQIRMLLILASRRLDAAKSWMGNLFNGWVNFKMGGTFG